MASNQLWEPPEADFSGSWSPPEADFAGSGAPAVPINTASLGPEPAPDPYTGEAPGDLLAASEADSAGDIVEPTDSGAVNFARGMGNTVADTATGVYQLGASIGHAMGLVSDQKLAQIQSQIDAKKEAEAPLMTTTGGELGSIAGYALPALVLPEAGILGSAAEGTALGAAQPVATGQSRLQDAELGGMGGAAGAVFGRVMGGVLGGFGGSGGRQAAVDLLDKEGIPVSTAQATGSKLAQTVERASGITSGAPADFATEQAAAFNRAVLKRIGVTDPNVTSATSDVLGPAKDAITDSMDAVASRTQPRVDDTFLNGLADVEQSATRQLPASDIAPISQNINDILQNASENNGKLDGIFVQKLNANLGALSRNPSTAPIASDLQDVVNDAVHRYATEGDADILNVARQRYRALKQIEPAIDPATGNISVPKLMNSLNSKTFGGRNQTLYGKGDQSLIDLAKAAKSVIPDNLGNSGTAERAIPLVTALDVAASGEPVKAGLKAAVGTLGLNAAGKAMRNQGVIGNYLKNGISGVNTLAPAVSRFGAPLGIGTAESNLNDTTPQYATGGKVDHEALVNQLISKWKAAKKASDKTTEPLLKFPDAAITRALNVAQTHL